MFSGAPLGDIAHVIQLAIAPVFLLTGIGAVLNVLAARLGRAVDRRRSLVAALPRLADEAIAALAREELGFQERRIQLIYVAVSMAVLSALLVCLLISLAFVDAFVAMDLARPVAALFVLSMLALTASMALFLREIFLAVKGQRAPLP